MVKLGHWKQREESREVSKQERKSQTNRVLQTTVVKKAERWRIDAFELWCQRRLLRVPWTATVQPVNHKGNQSWIFIGRTDAEAETPILWPPDAKNWLIGKDPDAGKGWRAEREGEDRGCNDWMASLTPWTWVWVSSRSWWLTGKPGVLCSPWGHRESDMNERLKCQETKTWKV